MPVGVAAYALTRAKVVESRDPEARGVDWIGLVSFSAAIFLFIYALIRGNEEGWGSSLILGLFAGSLALLALFAVAELRRRRPMLDISLFRKPAFAGASIVAFALSASSFAMLLYLTLYLQNVLGFTPFETGVRVLPITLMAFAVAPLAGKLSTVVPVRALMGVGLALAGLGLALMHGVSAGSEWTALLGGFLFVGAGVGIINPVLVSTAVGVVPPARSGMASGINNTFRQLGLATGIAGFGAIFQSKITDKLDGALAGAAADGGPSGTDLARWAATGQTEEVAAALPPATRPIIVETVPEAFVAGLNQVFLVGSILAFTGALLAVLLIRQRDFVDPATPQPEVRTPGTAPGSPAASRSA